ncbi:MAG TPA: hypothetical protein VFM66_11750 [Agromyces sp.]|nr:hypothetical protein [Agromyces sp.]
MLVEALQVFEDETSKSTGLPVWLARSGDPAITFEVHEGVDLADAAIQEFDKAQKGPKGDKEPPAGSYRYVLPQSLDGSPVPEGGIERERLLREASERQRTGGEPLPGSTIDIPRKRPAGGYDISEYG